MDAPFSSIARRRIEGSEGLRQIRVARYGAVPLLDHLVQIDAIVERLQQRACVVPDRRQAKPGANLHLGGVEAGA